MSIHKAMNIIRTANFINSSAMPDDSDWCIGPKLNTSGISYSLSNTDKGLLRPRTNRLSMPPLVSEVILIYSSCI